MKRKKYIIIVATLFLISCSTKKKVTTNPCEKDRILYQDSLTTGMMGLGTFSKFKSYLYTTQIAKISTDNPIVEATRLKGLSDSKKFLSMNEIFNMIAYQTNSTWEFDTVSCYFVFSSPMPFELGLAEGWTKGICDGGYIFKPSIAPVGMDVYFAGFTDTSETQEDAMIRISKRYAEPFNNDLKADDLQKIKLDNHIAYYYETNAQKKGVIWRQWAFVDDGLSFVIVSAIDSINNEKLLPDVKQMVNSFKIIE
ncbi:MAG: hypothetical protein Kapaf2KO_15800 [Candidatus Kapaibacteriales bacterium]